MNQYYMKAVSSAVIYLIFFLLFWMVGGCKLPDGNTALSNNDNPPNIIIILVDDAGYIDFGFMGSRDLETPRIDQLADKGVIFSDAHVSASVCAPSRAGIMTGRYQQRFGFECNGTGGSLGLDPGESTIADVLKHSGYITIAIGKWHLGHSKEYSPNERGFDEFYGFLGGSRSYFPLENPGYNSVIRHNSDPVEFDGYLTDVFGDKAVEYIEQYKERPFFLYLSFNAVHTPMHAKDEHLEKYTDHSRRELAAMTWSLDENVGKVVDKLEDEELLDNTVIFFLSDNGGSPYNQASNGPLKGWKGNKFEGGHRVSYFITWPAQMEGNSQYDGMVSSLDIFSTSVSAAGINDYSGKVLDGVDLLPYLKKEVKGDPHPTLFWRKDKMAAVRSGHNKVIRLDDYGYSLYDLKNDPGESSNLLVNEPGIFSSLNTKLEEWEEELIDPLWIEEEEWNIVTYEIHRSLMENRIPNYRSPGERKQYMKKINKY